ncbi:hypothetical protein ACJX0J_007771, partial [Zea mays]
NIIICTKCTEFYKLLYKKNNIFLARKSKQMWLNTSKNSIDVISICDVSFETGQIIKIKNKRENLKQKNVLADMRNYSKNVHIHDNNNKLADVSLEMLSKHKYGNQAIQFLKWGLCLNYLIFLNKQRKTHQKGNSTNK